MKKWDWVTKRHNIEKMYFDAQDKVVGRTKTFIGLEPLGKTISKRGK